MKGSQVLNWEFLLFGEGIFGKSMLKTVFRRTPKIAFLIHWYLTLISKHAVLKLKILKTQGQTKYFPRFHQKTCVFSEQTWGQTNPKHYRSNSVQNVTSFKILNNVAKCIPLDPGNKILIMKWTNGGNLPWRGSYSLLISHNFTPHYFNIYFLIDFEFYSIVKPSIRILTHHIFFNRKNILFHISKHNHNKISNTKIYSIYRHNYKNEREKQSYYVKFSNNCIK
jgi:hypothetical protein